MSVVTDDSYVREMLERPLTADRRSVTARSMRPTSRQSVRPHTTRPYSQQRVTLVPELQEPRFVPIQRCKTAGLNEVGVQATLDDGTGSSSDRYRYTSDHELLPGLQRAAQAADSGNVYYQRLLEQLLRERSPAVVQRPNPRIHALKGNPVYRQGHGGASWRHITHCVGMQGQNIMYIDGSVKEEDCRRFPPHGYPSSSVITYNSVENRLAPRPVSRFNYATGRPRRPETAAHALSAERAKTNYRYWYEPKQGHKWNFITKKSKNKNIWASHYGKSRRPSRTRTRRACVKWACGRTSSGS